MYVKSYVYYCMYSSYVHVLYVMFVVFLHFFISDIIHGSKFCDRKRMQDTCSKHNGKKMFADLIFTVQARLRKYIPKI